MLRQNGHREAELEAGRLLHAPGPLEERRISDGDIWLYANGPRER